MIAPRKAQNVVVEEHALFGTEMLAIFAAKTGCSSRPRCIGSGGSFIDSLDKAAMIVRVCARILTVCIACINPSHVSAFQSSNRSEYLASTHW